MSDVTSAKRRLKERLIESRGEDLSGVVTFGAHWQGDTLPESLDIIVETDEAYHDLKAELPPVIDGHQVRLFRGGSSSFD